MQATKSIKYNGFTTKGGNYLWGAALGLAWHQLIDKFAKQNIKVQSDNLEVTKIVQNFNNSQFTLKDIDNRFIYVKSGYGPQTLKQINIESKKKFPEKSFDDINIPMQPQDIISYAYLLKKLQFETKFKRESQKNFLFKQQKVQSFWASQKKQKQQIKCLYYKNKDQFMITIQAKNPNDQIYFIKDKNIQTIDDAVNKVKDYQKKGRSQMKQQDEFQMPVVQIDVERNVDELIGKKLLNKNLLGYMFGVVYEAIKLKIDESGAKVENEAVIMLLRCAMIRQPEEPKYFVFDNDFWVVMKQKGKNPYFCSLISNPIDTNK